MQDKCNMCKDLISLELYYKLISQQIFDGSTQFHDNSKPIRVNLEANVVDCCSRIVLCNKSLGTKISIDFEI